MVIVICFVISTAVLYSRLKSIDEKLALLIPAEMREEKTVIEEAE